MNNFKGGFKGGQKFDGKKKFGGDNKFSGGQRREQRPEVGSTELFSATCSECQKKCDVPFKPSPDKPVYCSACFGMKKSGNELRSENNGGNRERKPFGNGKVNNGPAFSSAPAGPTAQNILELKQQVSALEVKLNKILDLLNPPQPAVKATVTEAEPPKKKVVKKVTPAKTVATKTAVKKVTKKAAPKKETKK